MEKTVISIFLHRGCRADDDAFFRNIQFAPGGVGWDALVGLGMSLLAIGCGFAAGICNPFTVGVAQELAGIPMFSGLWFRALSFVLIYILLICFLKSYAKKIEKPILSGEYKYKKNKAMDKGILCFVIILGIGIALVLSSIFITVLQDYNIIIVAVMFLAAGIVAVKTAGMSNRRLRGTFLSGLTSVLPAVLMILMANSI